MFVAIDNKNMDALKVEEWINPYRDDNGGVISPEFAMEILGKTNYFAHIKKVINNIKKACLDENGKLVADEVLAYKDVVRAYAPVNKAYMKHYLTSSLSIFMHARR